MILVVDMVRDSKKVKISAHGLSDRHPIAS
jgi:hypothetical protein